MIDLKELRDDPQRFRDGAANKNTDPAIVDELLRLDAEFREAQQAREKLAAEQNQIGKQIGALAGKLKKADGADKAALQAEMTALQARPNVIKEELKSHDESVKSLRTQLDDVWLLVPQPADPDVPVGRSSAENVSLRTWHPDWFDPEKTFEANKGFKPRSHVELGEALGMVDFERGVKEAGSRSYILKGAGSLLHQAVLRFAFDYMIHENGFTAVTVPVLVRDQLMVGTGFFPHGKDQAYEVANPTSEGNSQALTGTGEVGLMGLHMDEIVDEADLPLTYTTMSTCFRREAGAAGKDTAGLYRIHQFDKVEQVVICKADEVESRDWHQKMIGFVEGLLQRLEIPYQLLQCCTGDLGPKNADQIDVESWMPSRGDIDDAGTPTGAYGETHSASRLYDYQCRRLNLRYRPADGKGSIVCHALNNTVAASPRILIPIMELYQNADGSITVPEALRPYMNGLETIKAS